MATNPKIIIVSNDEIYRRGLACVLGDFDFVRVIGELPGGDELIKTLKYVNCDILIIDIFMKGPGGIETAKKALKINADMKIVGITDVIERDLIREILDAGFYGLLSKDTNKAGFEHILQDIIKGKKFYSSTLITMLFERKKKENEKPCVTKREMEILQLCADGLTGVEIADKLKVSYRTVTNHKNNMHKKIGVSNTVQLISWGIKNKIIHSLN